MQHSRDLSFRRDQGGFTGAEKALLICFGLAIITLVGFLISSGSQKAATDAKRTLSEQGGSLAQLGQAVKPIQAAGPGSTPGSQGGPGQGPGTSGGGEPGSGGEPGKEGEKEPTWKAGVEGSGKSWDNKKNTSWGDSKPKNDEEAAKQKKGKLGDVEVGVEKKFLDKQGAVKEWEFAGKSEKVSAVYGKLEGTGYAKASWNEGASAGVKFEGKGSVVNWQGKHELPLGIQEKHEVDVLSVKGTLDTKAGISKELVGAKISGEAGANLAEGKIEGKKTFKLPFIPIGIELGAAGSASAGANIGGEASGGYFKEEGKSKLGFKLGGKAALGLGLGGKLSLNIVW